MSRPNTRIAAACLPALLLGMVLPSFARAAEPAPAQPASRPDGPSPSVAEPAASPLTASVEVEASAEYAPRKNLDDGSRLENVRAAVDVATTLRWDGFSLDVRAGHEAERYRARSGGRLGDEGFDVRLGATSLSLTLAHQGPTFGEFVGADVESAAEYGADLGSSLTVGGHAGFLWVADPTLVLGLGVQVRSQLVGGLQVLPLPILDWRPVDAFRVTTIGRFGPGGSLEVVVSPHEIVEVSVGATYDNRQHRLDEGGPAPEGAIQDEGLPVWLGVGVTPVDGLRFDGFVGTTFAGAFNLTDPNDEEVIGGSYDPNLAVGAVLTLTFDELGGAEDASDEGR